MKSVRMSPSPGGNWLAVPSDIRLSCHRIHASGAKEANIRRHGKHQGMLPHLVDSVGNDQIPSFAGF
jgi:hypothetical protein